MQVTYCAPNRAHHYLYAVALARAGCLRAFVTGFSRFSPRAALPEVGDRLVRADHLQNVYLLGLKMGLPEAATDWLGYFSKCWMDRMAEAPARESDIFLFYNGAGLRTARRLKNTRAVRVLEVVSSHALFQQRILGEEHRRLGIPFRPFLRADLNRRLNEYAEADAVLCPSTFVRASLIAEGVPEGSILMVPYGLNLHAAEVRQPRGENDVFRVLFVGQINIRKGLRYLFQAFAKLKHRRKELLIVGPKTEITGIDDVTPPTGVKFAGVLKGEALSDAYRSSSVFVLPTLEEGLALVMGEALSFGLPVIATQNSGSVDLFEEGIQGWHVPIRNPEAILEKLQLLADDPGLLRTMSVAASAHSSRFGGWEASGSLLVRRLESLLASRSEG